MFCRSSPVKSEGEEDVESAHSPSGSAVLPPGPSDPLPPTKSVRFLVDPQRQDSEEAIVGLSEASPIASPNTPLAEEPGTEVSIVRARFRNLVRNAVMVHRLTGLGNEAMANASRSDQKAIETFTKPRSSRVSGLLPKLQNMSPIQDIAAHAALVRHMQVSVLESSFRDRC